MDKYGHPDGCQCDFCKNWCGPVDNYFVQPAKQMGKMQQLNNKQKSTLLLLAQELDFLYEQIGRDDKAIWAGAIVNSVFQGKPVNYSAVRHKLIGLIIHLWSGLLPFEMTLKFRLCTSETWQVRNHKVHAKSLDDAFEHVLELLLMIGADEFQITCWSKE